jgi:3-oxoacyl-[acyl-carrier-protein] synthase II
VSTPAQQPLRAAEGRGPRVVVTGCGMITPLGPDVASTFELASQGRSGIGWITAFDTTGLPCRIGGQVDERWILEDEAADRYDRLVSRGTRLLLAAAGQAASQARLEEIPDRGRIAVAVGSHGANPSVSEIMFLHRFTDGEGRWDLPALLAAGGYDHRLFFRRKPDIAPGFLAERFACGGPNLSIVSACAASAQAIGEAYRYIREGRCVAALAGGCEAALTFVGFVGFCLLKAMAEKYTAPETASRPFDRKRNGFVMSEGAGALVLEDLDHASARGAAILGEVLGYGDSADAYRITDTHPTGEGAALAMRRALADAALPPEAVDYINAHGTSTTQNDIAETKAIHAVFGERAKGIPVSSNKSMLGHTIGAAGAIEAILTLEGMRAGVILPTINHEFPDPKCDLDYVPNAARRAPHRVALSNSFGFGGQNASLCLGRHDG